MAASVTDETPKEVDDLRVRLVGDMQSIHDAKVKDLKAESMEDVKKLLSKALYMPFTSTFEDLPEDTWSTLRGVKGKVVKEHYELLDGELAGLGLAAAESHKCKADLAAFGKERYNNLIEEAVKSAPKIIKDKFVKAFCYDGKGMPRVWGPRVDVGEINAAAKKEAVSALSLLAISQIEGDRDLSEVEEALETLALASSSSGAASAEGGSSAPALSSLFASDSWPDLDREDVLLDPIECRSVWRQMESEISYTVSQAVTAHEAAKQASNRGPPLWTIIAMLFLGWNELMSLLYNPVLLVLLILLFVLGRAVYTRIDLGAELEKGFIPALISISMKLTPILIEVSQQFAWQIKEAIEKNAQAGQVQAQGAAGNSNNKKED